MALYGFPAALRTMLLKAVLLILFWGTVAIFWYGAVRLFGPWGWWIASAAAVFWVVVVWKWKAIAVALERWEEDEFTIDPAHIERRMTELLKKPSGEATTAQGEEEK